MTRTYCPLHLAGDLVPTLPSQLDLRHLRTLAPPGLVPSRSSHNSHQDSVLQEVSNNSQQALLLLVSNHSNSSRLVSPRLVSKHSSSSHLDLPLSVHSSNRLDSVPLVVVDSKVVDSVGPECLGSGKRRRVVLRCLDRRRALRVDLVPAVAGMYELTDRLRCLYLIDSCFFAVNRNSPNLGPSEEAIWVRMMMIRCGLVSI